MGFAVRQAVLPILLGKFEKEFVKEKSPQQAQQSGAQTSAPPKFAGEGDQKRVDTD